MGETSLTAPQVAEMLNIGRNAVYDLAKNGELGSYRIGRKLRFTLKDVETYINSSHSSSVKIEGVGLPGELVLEGDDIILDVLANYLSSLSIKTLHRSTSSYQALFDLYQGNAQLAGISMWDTDGEAFNTPFVKWMLPGVSCILFRLARSTEGLLVRSGNPKGLRSWSDLATEGVVLANRSRGTGARILLDTNLRKLEMPTSRILGYDHETASDLQAGAMVAQGLADVTIGSERIFNRVKGLDYLPLAQVELGLVVVKNEQTKGVIKLLRSLLRNKGFHDEFRGQAYLDLSRMGAVAYEV